MPKNRQYLTSDMGCAAGLIACGYAFAGIRPENERRNYFVFDMQEGQQDIDHWAKRYFAGDMMVDALAMSNAFRQLKASLHNNR